MLAVTWLFGFTTVVGLVLTVYYGRKSAKLELARKNWSGTTYRHALTTWERRSRELSHLICC